MAAVDVFILLILVLSILYGIRKGAISQLGSILGVIAGIIICRLFGSPISKLFVGNNPDPDDVYISGVFTNIVLFIAVYLAVKAMSGALKDITHALKLSLLDRIAGGVFSFFEWFFIFSLLLNVWQAFQPDRDILATSKSFSGRPAEFIINLAPRVVGSETARTLFNKFEQLSDPDNHDDDSDNDDENTSDYER